MRKIYFFVSLWLTAMGTCAADIPLAGYGLGYSGSPCGINTVQESGVLPGGGSPPPLSAPDNLSLGTVSGPDTRASVSGSMGPNYFSNICGFTYPIRYVGAQAELYYSFSIAQTAPTFVGTVPLDISALVYALTNSGIADPSSQAVAVASVVIVDQTQSTNVLIASEEDASVAGMCTPCAGNPLLSYATVSAPIGDIFEVALQADGNAIGTLSNSSFYALADPTVIIDPSFAYASDFAIEYSANLSNTNEVSEPSSLTFLGLVLLILTSEWRKGKDEV